MKKKWLDAIFKEPFDASDPVEWFLLLMGAAALGFIIIHGVIQWIGQ